WLTQGCWWKITSACIRRETYLALGGLDAAFRAQGDIDFALRVLAAGHDVTYIPMSLMVYRVHDRSVTAGALAHCYDLYGDLKIIKRFGSSLEPAQRKHVYFREAHASAHRTLHAFAERRFECAARAVILGGEFS